MKRKCAEGIIQKSSAELRGKVFHADSPMWQLIFAFFPPNFQEFVQLVYVQKAWTLQKFARLLTPRIYSWNVPKIASLTNLRRLSVWFVPWDAKSNAIASDCLKEFTWIDSLEILVHLQSDDTKLCELKNLHTLGLFFVVDFTLLEEYLRSMKYLTLLKLDRGLFLSHCQVSMAFQAKMELSRPSLKISFE